MYNPFQHQMPCLEIVLQQLLPAVATPSSSGIASVVLIVQHAWEGGGGCVSVLASGFATFLFNKQLPRGIIPRYRGNRLHILFHTCGIYVQYHSVLANFLETGTLCGGLRASLLLQKLP